MQDAESELQDGLTLQKNIRQVAYPPGIGFVQRDGNTGVGRFCDAQRKFDFLNPNFGGDAKCLKTKS